MSIYQRHTTLLRRRCGPKTRAAIHPVFGSRKRCLLLLVQRHSPAQLQAMGKPWSSEQVVRAAAEAWGESVSFASHLAGRAAPFASHAAVSAAAFTATLATVQARAAGVHARSGPTCAWRQRLTCLPPLAVARFRAAGRRLSGTHLLLHARRRARPGRAGRRRRLRNVGAGVGLVCSLAPRWLSRV